MMVLIEVPMHFGTEFYILVGDVMSPKMADMGRSTVVI